MFVVIGEFFAGKIIPIPLMPAWLQTVASALPFRWTADFPFRVYSGHIPADEALLGLFAQSGWLIVIVWLGKVALGKALRRVVIQGG